MPNLVAQSDATAQEIKNQYHAGSLRRAKSEQGISRAALYITDRTVQKLETHMLESPQLPLAERNNEPMRQDPRRAKLIENLLAGMSKAAAARAAGYSESYARVNVFATVKSPEFQEELARARAASKLRRPLLANEDPARPTHNTTLTSASKRV